jgi:hypothetical protein
LKFGPFSESDAKKIEEVLDSREIAVVRSHSEEQVEAWRQHDRARTPSNYPAFQGFIENVFFEISESDLEKLGDELEPYGIGLADDGESELDVPEEYLCLRCDFSSGSPQLCPRHRMPLVTFSDKAQWLTDRQARRGKFVSRLIAIGVVVLGLYLLLLRFRLV